MSFTLSLYVCVFLQGYAVLSQSFGCIRRVRGDNYCALRATLYQVLMNTTQLPEWLQQQSFLLVCPFPLPFSWLFIVRSVITVLFIMDCMAPKKFISVNIFKRLLWIYSFCVSGDVCKCNSLLTMVWYVAVF